MQKATSFLVACLVVVAGAFLSAARAASTDEGPAGISTLPVIAVNPAAGTYTASVDLTFTATTGSVIHYTLDGSEPTEASPEFVAPITIERSMTVRGRAFHPEQGASTFLAATYTIVTADPTLSLSEGEYPGGQSVTLLHAAEDAVLRYTITGTDPTEADTGLAPGASLVIGNFPLKVRAYRAGCLPSGVVTANYTVSGTVATPLAAAGLYLSVVTASDGTVWAWGNNGSGSVGDGTLVNRRTPVRVASLTGTKSVAAGNSFGLGLALTGQVTAWGWNPSLLGDGTSVNRPMPVPVLGMADATAIAAQLEHSLAARADGSLWSWGHNYHGELGDGTNVTRNVPVQVLGISNVIGVATGNYGSVAITADGLVWGWGYNGYGQVGDGTTTDRWTPVQVPGLSGVTAIAAGIGHRLALRSDGTVWAWGYNYYGQLGDGTGLGRLTPVQVPGLLNVVAIAAAGWRSFAITADGTLWAWGSNLYGALGDGGTTNRLSPIPITALSNVTAIAAEEHHSVAITTDGTVYTWGLNSYGQLGDGTTTARTVPVAISGPGMAWRVATPAFSVAPGTYYADVSVVVTDDTPGATIRYTLNGAEPTEGDATIVSGSTLTIGTSQTLKAKAWKDGMPSSATGVAAYELRVAWPTFMPGGGTRSSPVSVTLSTATVGAQLRYSTDGSVPNENSTLYTTPITIGTTTVLKVIGVKPGWTSSPTATDIYTMNFGAIAPPVASPTGAVFTGSVAVTLAASGGATIRYTTNGTEPTSGSAIYTQPLVFGATTTVKAKAFHPDFTTSATATQVYTITTAPPVFSLPSGQHAPGASVSISHPDPGAVIRITLNGADPVAADPSVPSGTSLAVGVFTLKARAFKTGALDSVVTSASYSLTAPLGDGSVAGSGGHTLLCTPDGRVFAWGSNSYGQLGDGTTTQRRAPTLLPTLTGVVEVAAGQYHSVARSSDGRVWTWGGNGYGQLGDGTTSQNAVPRPVAGLQGAVAVAAGYYHSLAVTADGTVWAWGANTNGQLGDGTIVGKTIPTPIASLPAIGSIAAGASHTVAAAADGSVWSWGLNSYGQLGNGTTNQRTTPGQVLGVSGVDRVVAGAYHTLAKTSSGELWAWGQNNYGQLGDGTTSQRNSATHITSLTDVVAASAGQSHSVAVLLDGAVRAWGANASGQLGDHTTTQRTSPVALSDLAATRLLAAGDWHTVAVLEYGSVWAWGSNSFGQVGDGTWVSRQLPVSLSEDDTDWRASTPAFSVAQGTYSAALSVTMTTVTAAAVIHYTVDGSEPTEGDTVASGPVAIDRTMTLKARAWKPGMPPSNVDAYSYVLQPTVPTISPGGGTFSSPQMVTMTSATAGVTIRYTTDGTDPTEASVAYETPITVASSMTVKARAFKPGWSPSPVRTVTFTFSYGALPAPTASPAPGAYANDVGVTLQGTLGSTIRYTTNGSEPTATSSVYASPVVLAATATLKAKAFQQDWAASPTLTGVYTIQAAAPVASPPGGQYDGPQLVTLSTSTERAEIRYTTDGSEPDSASALYASPFVVGANVTVKAKAFRTGCDASPMTTIVYQVIDTVPPTISATLDPPANAAGWNNTNVTVTFTCVDSGLPAASCTPPVTVARNGAGIEVTGVAVDAAGNRSELTVLLNIDRFTPRLSIYSPEPGDYLPPTTTSVTVRGNVLESPSGTLSVACGAQAALVTGQSFACDVAVSPGTNTVSVTAQHVAGTERTATLTFLVADPPAPTSLQVSPRKMTMFAGESREIRVLDERGRAVTGGTWTVNQPLVAQVAVQDGVTGVTAIASGEATLTFTRDGLSADAIVTVLASGSALPEGTALWESAPLGAPSVKRGQVIRANRWDDGSTPSADLFFIDEGTEGAGELRYRVDNRPTVIRAMTFDGRELWSRVFTEPMIKDVAADGHGGLILVLTNAFESQSLPERVQRLDGATGHLSWQFFPHDDGSLSDVAVHPDGKVFVTVHGYYYPDVTYLVAINEETGATSRWRLPDGCGVTGPIVRDDGSVVILFRTDPDDTHLQLATLANPNGALVFAGLSLATPDRYMDPTDWRLIPHEDALLLAKRYGETKIIRIGADNTMSPTSRLLPPEIDGATEIDYAVAGSIGLAIIKRRISLYNSPQFQVYTAAFDPVTLASGASPAGNDPYFAYRFITADGQADASGEAGGTVGPNDTQVAPGLWATFGGTASLREGPQADVLSSSGYLQGGVVSTNAPTIPSVTYFFPVDPKQQAPSATRTELFDRFHKDGVGQWPVFRQGSAATASEFLRALGRGDPIVAFIGHATEDPPPPQCAQTPSCQATGLMFADKVLTRKPYVAFQDSGKPSSEWQHTVQRVTITARSKVVFIAACRLGDVLRSLWSFHQNQAFVLAEVGGNQGTNSHDAYLALLALTYELGKGKTVGEAVDYMNNETLKNVSLKFAVYGGRNVTVR